MSKNLFFRPLVFMLLSVASNVVYSNCLEEVKAFAGDICGDILVNGSSELVDSTGKLNADVSGIVRRVIGGADAGAKARRLIETYENVLREDLPRVLSDVRACRQTMVDVAVARVCPSGLDCGTIRSDYNRLDFDVERARDAMDAAEGDSLERLRRHYRTKEAELNRLRFHLSSCP